jgi:hypothetical protein
MAGAGAKKFPAFSKLASDDVNNYLMDQTIMRFATTTARDAAFGGVGEPTLAEGMTAYIDADNSIYTYDGSNWVKMVSASTPPAMELVKTQTFSASSGVEIQTCFNSNYENYSVYITLFGSASTNTQTQYMTGTNTRDIAATYNRFGFYWNVGVNNFNIANQTSDFLINHGTTLSDYSTAQMTIYRPNVSTVRTNSTVFAYSGDSGLTTFLSFSKATTVAYTGLYLFPTSGTITGTVSVYGFRQ